MVHVIILDKNLQSRRGEIMLKRRICIIIAAVLTIAMGTGCTMFSEDYVAKVGTEKITKAEYNFFQKYAENYVQQNIFGGNL